MKYLYRGLFIDCFSDTIKKQQLKTFGFTDDDFSIGSIIICSKGFFKVLVKETYSNDCAEHIPFNVEFPPCIEKTKTSYKIHWDMPL